MDVPIKNRQIMIALGAGVLVIGGLIVGTFFTESSRRVVGCADDQTIVIAREARADDPRIWGDWAVWVKRIQPAPNPIGLEGDIFAYHVPTGRIHAIATGPSLQSVPRIHDSNLVWREEPFDGGPVRLMMAQLGSEARFELDDSRFVNMIPRSVYGPRVVFMGESADKSVEGLYTYDFLTKNLTRITMKGISSAEIWKDDIAFVLTEEGQPRQARLTLFHLGNQTLETVHVSPFYPARLDLRDGLLAFERSNESNLDEDDIFMINLTTRKEEPAATNDLRISAETLPRLGQNSIAYMDHVGDPAKTRIMVLRLSDHHRVQVYEGGMEPEHDYWDGRSILLGIGKGTWDVTLRCVHI